MPAQIHEKPAEKLKLTNPLADPAKINSDDDESLATNGVVHRTFITTTRADGRRGSELVLVPLDMNNLAPTLHIWKEEFGTICPPLHLYARIALWDRKIGGFIYMVGSLASITSMIVLQARNSVDTVSSFCILETVVSSYI
jgi:hypothetical protein